MILATALGLFAGATGMARAGQVTTVNWAADNTVDGVGTGTLGGITVNYSTSSVGGGFELGGFWNTSPATDGAVGSGVTSLTAAALATASPAQLQTISFSAAIVNPILYFTFTDPGSSINFGVIPLTLLDSNNAQLAGPVATFTGSTNNSSDGFAAQATGSFTSLQFLYGVAPGVAFNNLSFTVGINPADQTTATPEPATLASAAIAGLASLAAFGRRRRAPIA